MSDKTDDQEKTEEATPRRLEKAREEGQVARSRELTTFTMLLGGVLCLSTMGSYLYQQLRAVMESAFLFDRRGAMEAPAMMGTAWDLGQQALTTLMPLFIFMTVLALVSPMLLGGFLVSSKALVPQLSKLNPIKGFKRIFSTQALAELAKVIAKIVLMGTVAALFMLAHEKDFMALLHLPIDQALVSMLKLSALACGVMVLSLVVVILIDVPFQLWNHAKQLRMSKEEIKREHKESEGDPHIKGHIRAQQQAMARKRMMSKVPEADVIITNPTHYAVALKYDEQRMAAPRVIAKGADAVAMRIRALGTEHGVPLLEAPPLARALYRHVDLDREVPVELYTAVAEVMAWAVSLKRGDADTVIAPPSHIEVPESMDPHAT
ncbi:MAG: flagellar type III secretion system protein FlhB [Gammaproteobacteria bacterium]|nr:MAG: flagellar type III secretion system protein FlhB [Gammaproteobacteria bacterium]